MAVNRSALLYETKQDLLDTLVPYFKSGLENNELCVWAVSEPLTEQDARYALSQGIPGFGQYLTAGALDILPDRDWYLKNDQFDLKRITIPPRGGF